MAKTKAQIEFQAVTSGFNNGIKAMDDSLGTLRKELNLNSAELKENADDVDLLGKRKEILQKESEATANKIELMKNKLAEAERLFGSSSNEVRLLSNKILDTQTAFQKIQNEITQTDSKLDKLENGLNETEQELKQVDNASQELEGGFSVLKDAMGDLLANGVQAVTDGLKELAVDSDTSMSKFQAQTGLSTEEMKKFEGAMEDIYSKNLGESLGDIANAMAEVKQQTKETDPSNLQKMTENALMLRDTFDMDVKESMRAVNSLMNQFGLDGDQAFNLVVQGAQKGLNANGDMLDVINEYSVQFKNAGFSADNMFNMLLNGAESGTWSVDKLGDAVKEFNIRASDGTVADSIKENAKALGLTSTEARKLADGVLNGDVEAYEKLIGKLKDVDDYNERYRLGVEMFGTMWEDLGEEAVYSLMETEGGISSAKQSMEEMASVRYDNVTHQMGEIGRMIQNDFIIPIVEKLLPPLKDGLTWIKDNMNTLLPIITGIGIALGTYFVVAKVMSFIGVVKNLIGLVKTGTTVFGALNTVMALNPIALIVGAIVGLIAIFVLLWNKCDGFREFWINLWNKIKSVFTVVVEAVKTGFSKFKDLILNVVSAIKTGFQNWLNFLGTIASWINENVIQPVIKFFKGLLDGVKKVWDGIVNAIKFVFNLIVAIIKTYFQLITLPFQFIWVNCKDIIMKVFNAIKDFISNTINTIKNIITFVFNVVKTYITTVFNFYKTIITTVWNAIKSVITTVVNGIKNVVTKVFNAVKTFISTVFNGIKTIASNVWNGIKNTISNVVNTIKNVISNVFNAIKSVTTGIWNGIKTVIINPIKNAYNTIKTTVGNIKSSIVNKFNEVKSKVTSIFTTIKDKITKPVETAKDKIKGIVDKIKGFFNFEFKTPKLKVPKFSISPKGWKVKDLLEGSIPKLSIKWNAEGGIFRKPTIFNTQNAGPQGVGEAGAEAILPLDKLESWINSGFGRVADNNYYANEKIDELIEIGKQILDKPSDIYMDKTKVGYAMSETNDNIGGQRVTLKNRGLMI